MKNSILRIYDKKSRIVIGLLSGTSIDGIDAVLTKISGNGKSTNVKILDFITLPIPQIVKSAILKNSNNKTAKIEELCRLNVIIGALFADAVLRLLKKNKMHSSQIDLIGSHGQTILHLPERKKYLGYKVKSTLQIGDPAIIANLTGISTVGDFRIADCAVGGDGAPLVPFMDYILFSHKSRNRALVNIGGIANITFLRKNSNKDNVMAFDTGPGNMVIDGLMKKFFGEDFDRNGRTSRKGKVDDRLFRYINGDSFYTVRPPKSTGREHYGINYQKMLLKKAKELNKFDIIRTVTEFTAYSIWQNYIMFAPFRINELVVSGGGAENPVIMNSLKRYFSGVKVRKMDDLGITTQNKEAVLFAILANECISGNPANMKSVTGSTRDVVLGKICLA